MIEISGKAKVRVNWMVTPYDFSKEKANELQVAFAKKYGIHKDSVNVVPDLYMPDTAVGSSILSEVTNGSIQEPEFQRKLYLEYLKLNDIKDYDTELIDSIDKDINSKIDYVSYDTHRKFLVKWIRWSNFQSYGADNSFDFGSLDGLVLLNGEPANQSGKTTFAVDLLHFLFFGKSEKWDKLEGLFNYTLPEATEMFVEGCVTIDGEEYIIKRTITRPALSKRTSKSKVTHKVDYYRVVGDSMEGLDEYVEENGEDARKTNKIIKESIGSETDFDLMMCITGSNLDALIDEKPTEKGRLFSRWIGLLALEEKDAIARDKFNRQIKPSLLMNQYNRETLKSEIETLNAEINECEKKAAECDSDVKSSDEEIVKLEETRKSLMSSKSQIDADVLKIDITTLRNTLERKKNEGVNNKSKLQDIEDKINGIGDIDFSVEVYDGLVEKRTSLIVSQQTMRSEAKRLMELIRHLKTSEYCPTCGKKLDNVDNTAQISDNQSKLDEITVNGKEVGEQIARLESEIQSQKDRREKYMLLNSMTAQKSALEVQNERLRSDCMELIQKEKEYRKNSEAIDRNNELDISIRNTEVLIASKRTGRDHLMTTATQLRSNAKDYLNEIRKREDIIAKINEEEKLVYNWKLYLDMVGKNGISKMVIRNTLPIINARISQILDDVCDFDVNVDINSRNEVTFNIIRNGIVNDLNSGSGFEKTAAALALRSVLADISTISRMNFLVLDEILGRVASENYDKMRLLYERISKGYDFIFHITHINDVKDWHSHIVTVTKTKEGVSVLRTSDNR